MIAASCENKNPTDESIVNNTTPQTQDNHQKKKRTSKNTNGSGNSSTDTAPQTQGNQNQEKHKEYWYCFFKDWPHKLKDNSSKARKPHKIQGRFFLRDATPQTKDKEQEENRSGSGNSSTDTAPQTQGNQNQEKHKSTDIFSFNTAPTNSKTIIKSKKTPKIQGSFFLRDATPQTKDKEQEENRSGSGNSSTDTAPQTQDIQKQENKNKRKRKNNPKDLLKQLDEIKQEYEKAKKIMKN
nr:hypothetical protein [Mycoplasmopsis bovis]